FHKLLSNVSLVAFHYKSYGTFLILKKPYNLQGGFTHYRNYRAKNRKASIRASGLFFHELENRKASSELQFSGLFFVKTFQSFLKIFVKYEKIGKIMLYGVGR
ncbi:hypothetical protein, partial [Streptococcus cuniculi]|uniref:hypothetical protein n=1 Tax=Streptococcus cuniculi TaxID=1432788 RepID=UPI000A9D56E6